MKILVGVDCGATHLRIGLVREDGDLIGSIKTHSPLKHQPESLGLQIKQILDQLLQQHNLQLSNLASLGIGVPGPLDLQEGLILHSSNLANAQPIPVKRLVEQATNLPVFLDRDTNVALAGEKWRGAAQPYHQVIMLTLGTGVGGAILINDHIYRGANDLAGEIGHSYLKASLKPDFGQVCGLGHHGCLESIIKSRLPITARCHFLAFEIASLAAIFNPAMIVLGGGMMEELAEYLPAILEQAKDVGLPAVMDQLILAPADLGDLAGVYGAAQLGLS